MRVRCIIYMYERSKKEPQLCLFMCRKGGMMTGLILSQYMHLVEQPWSMLLWTMNLNQNRSRAEPKYSCFWITNNMEVILIQYVIIMEFFYHDQHPQHSPDGSNNTKETRQEMALEIKNSAEHIGRAVFCRHVEDYHISSCQCLCLP